MEDDNLPAIITSEDLRGKIYIIRGRQVMLDADLAEIYGYSTKAFNQQVQRNIEKFEGEDFMFRLTREEIDGISLRSQFVTLNNEDNLRSENLTSSLSDGVNNLRSQFVTSSWGGVRYYPYAFTEQGIYMLMTVLKGELATKQSRALVMTFKAMKDYLIKTDAMDQTQINNLVMKDHLRIDSLENYFNKQVEKEKLNKIFFDGQIYDAYSVLLDILNLATEEVIIIDNYIDKKFLDTIKNITKTIVIISSYIDHNLKEKYEKQYKNIKFIKNNTIHDRFIIIDRSKLYSCGASFKDLGKKCFAINEMENEAELNELLNKIFS